MGKLGSIKYIRDLDETRIISAFMISECFKIDLDANHAIISKI